MIGPRGAPLPGRDGRRYAVLACPVCGAAMAPSPVTCLGHVERDDRGLEPIYYRYVCPVCGPVEVHRARIVERG